jgi:hypothetical protein
MKPPQEIIEVLRGILALYQELLGIVQTENDELRAGFSRPLTGAQEGRKGLLPRLEASMGPLAECRARWQETNPALRAQHPEIGALVRQNQDVLMKIIVLDRENEQTLLRQGLVPPRDLPSVNRQRPHFVSDLYRRQGNR